MLPGHNAVRASPALFEEALRAFAHWEATGEDGVVLGPGRLRLLVRRPRA